MRAFTVNTGAKLILNKLDPLKIEKLRCTALHQMLHEHWVHTIVDRNCRFTEVTVKNYNEAKEYICYAHTEIQIGKELVEVGVKVTIPQAKDRILVEACPDYPSCDAVDIVEED